VIDLNVTAEGGINYMASSPDEEALVAAARHFGYFFHVSYHLFLQ
jgi:hypothetical protein